MFPSVGDPPILANIRYPPATPTPNNNIVAINTPKNFISQSTDTLLDSLVLLDGAKFGFFWEMGLLLDFLTGFNFTRTVLISEGFRFSLSNSSKVLSQGFNLYRLL